MVACASIMIKAGLRAEIVDAIADGRRPAGMSGDEEIVYEYASELLKNKQVSRCDTLCTTTKAEARFGAKGVVGMTGVVRITTFINVQLNVAQYPAPKEFKKLPRMPP